MLNFTQKWAVVLFLDEVEDEAEFFWKDWPLHVTLAPTFAVDWKHNGLIEKLSALLAQQKSLELIVEQELHWGKTNVMRLQKTPEITTLHTEIIDVLQNAGAIFNDPQYIGENFIPHSTVQKHASLSVGETIKLTSATIVDMFPHSNGHQRKVFKTIIFS